MFQFCIRELILLAIIVAMGLGWWIDRSKLAKENTIYEAWVATTSPGAHLYGDDERDIDQFLRWRESRKNP
jgi:hypothetical protein